MLRANLRRVLVCSSLLAACEAPVDDGLDDGAEDELAPFEELDADIEPQGDLVGPTSAIVGTASMEENADGDYRYPNALRVGGAYLHPIRRFGVAFVEAHGLANRRIEYRQVDADPASATFGSTVGPFLYATFGADDMVGMASTSVRRGTQTDGIFAYYDAGEIEVFEASGATGGITTPSIVRSSGYLFAGQHATVPALEAGRSGNVSRVLLADASWSYNYFTGTMSNRINFGLLQRATDGSYTATFTGSKPVQPPGSYSTCISPVYNIDAAFDADNREWTVAWMCGGLAVWLQRLNWDGVPVGDPFQLAADPSDPAHSGVMVSFNRTVDRFLVQYQHNVRVVRRAGDTYKCQDRLGNDVGLFDCSSNTESERLPGGRIGTGGTWATSVDYRAGTYFRVGGSCNGTCESAYPMSHGVSYSMEWLDEWGLSDPDIPNGWVREAGQVWSANDLVSLHRYVRGPDVGRTMLLHVAEPATGSFGTVRASFVDEAAVPVDE